MSSFNNQDVMNASGFISYDWWKNSASSEMLKEEAERKRKEEALFRARIEEQRTISLNSISPYQELQSDYLGRSSYYYSTETNRIYSFENDSGKFELVSGHVDDHLRKLNSL